MFLAKRYGDNVKNAVSNWSAAGGLNGGNGSINIGILLNGVYKEFIY